MNNEERMEEIKRRIQATLDVQEINVKDESHLHVGHAGAKDGRGHFSIEVVSPDFAGMSKIQRHKKIYEAMGELMASDIHALRMRLVESRGADVER